MPHKPFRNAPSATRWTLRRAKEAEIKMIKRKIQDTAAKAHSTDRSAPPAAKGNQSETGR